MADSKKVGIIGYWFATNYGGVSSYFSLYEKVKELGYEPFLVENPYFETDKEGDDVFSRNLFRAENCKIAQGYNNDNLAELNKLADTFLLGSDQVLTTSSIKYFGKLFLMEFAEESKKRIAISSSCGGDNLNSEPELIDFAKRELEKFTAVSVREYSAVDILKDKFNLSSDVIVDPVFFTTAEKYRQLGEKAQQRLEEPYVLAYILDPTEDKRKCIQIVSEHLSLPCKIALDGRKFTHESNLQKMGMPNETLPELDYYQWLNYYCNASYIVTDSFHGAVLALILNKPFVMYANRGRGYPRFVTLAQLFDIFPRLIDKSEDLDFEKIDEKINFEIINKIIRIEVAKASAWLEYSLLLKNKKWPLKAERNSMSSVQELLNKNPDFIKIRLLATLFRDYGIKHIVLSPGGRDVPIIRMFEYNENEFILHRVTDERSAAYYGLGIATQLRKPVACICTSGTAASNFLPAVTEAFYTGIPLIVVTADRYEVYLNHGEDQTIPQKKIYDGVVKKEISLPEASGWRAEYQARRDIADCILETTHNGFGPVHINVPVDNISIGANVPREYWKLSPFIYPHILRVGVNDGLNEIKKWVNSLLKSNKVLVVYGQNPPASERQMSSINSFASKYNCVIVTDHLGNIDCKYCVQPFNMLRAISQDEFNKELAPDILITVGGKRLMNDPLTFKVRGGPGNIRHWAVTPDGKVKDFYFRLSSVIEMSQEFFFDLFASEAGETFNNGVYYEKWRNLSEKHNASYVEGFNAIYIQSTFLPRIPSHSVLHLGVGQTFFDCRRFHIDKTVEVYCNMGTNGIDGCTSTFMGQCAVEKNKLCFLVVGDLSFFYDMNAIWNKDLSKNMRILMINNNGSGLLRSHNLRAVTSVHNTAAEGWVRSTGFDYMSAHNKEEFNAKLDYFISNQSDKALFFEVFCD